MPMRRFFAFSDQPRPLATEEQSRFGYSDIVRIRFNAYSLEMSVMRQGIDPFAPTTPPASPEVKKYFKLQIKAWTNFDPTDKRLSEIAQAIESGAGFVTVMEVTQITSLKEIGEGEV